MNGNFATLPLTSNTIFNSSPIYGHYPGSEPISPLEARFPINRNIGATPRPQNIGQEAGPLYSPQYPVSRSEVESQFALQHAQAECSRLKQQVLAFETQKLEQQNIEKFASTGTKRKRQPNAVRHYAQGFTFSTNFWTVEKAAVIVATTIPPDFDPQTHFTLNLTTPKLACQHALYCFLWELNEYLPEEAKHFMKNVSEMEKFLSYAQTLHSELQGHVKNNAAILLSEFDDITKEDYEDVADPSARANNLRFRDLLGYNSIPSAIRPQYPALCPLICREGDEFPFGTENIAKLLIIILFGKAQARAATPERHKGCNADNWGVKEVTPNMIAVAATMIRYLLSPDCTFTSLGTLSKIDWIATCMTYKTLIITNKDTPGIISLFETLNSRLFGGQAVPAHQPTIPALDNTFSTPVDTSIQSAIASLQSRRSAPPIDVSTSEPTTPIPNSGASSLSQLSTPLPPDPAELPDVSEDQAAAAHAEALIKNALNADSEVSSNEDDESDDGNDDLESISASSAPQLKPVPRSRPTPNNLNLLATIASTDQLPPDPSLPTPPLNTPATATSATGRASKRKADQPDYADLDENGEVDAPEQKKRKVVKKGANSAKTAKKGASSAKGKGASGVGSGSNPPATARPKRNTTAHAK